MASSKGSSILSAEWINERVRNVLNRSDDILDRLVFEGILASGYAPLETPINKKFLRRLNVQQLIQLLQSQRDAQANLETLRDLDLISESVYNEAIRALQGERAEVATGV